MFEDVLNGIYHIHIRYLNNCVPFNVLYLHILTKQLKSCHISYVCVSMCMCVKMAPINKKLLQAYLFCNELKKERWVSGCFV